MEEDNRPAFSGPWFRRIVSRVIWIVLGSFWEVLVPLIQYASVFFLIIIFSIVGYHLLNTSLLPKALISEPLYFDFSQTPPVARLSILSREKQWHYATDCAISKTKLHEMRENSTASTIRSRRGDPDSNKKDYVRETDSTEVCSGQDKRRFLRSGFKYSVDVMFGLASSTKNINLGKFMVFTRIIDTAGGTVAVSSRPVVVPYQSYVTLFLDAVVKYPLRAAGILQTAEVTDVLISVMNDFREPTDSSRTSSSPYPPVTTEYLELHLSSSDVDIGYAVITVMPSLSGLTWYMYYYPHISWLLGVAAVTALQLGLLLMLLVIRYLGLLMLRESDSGELEGEEEPTSTSSSPIRLGRRRGRATTSTPISTPRPLSRTPSAQTAPMTPGITVQSPSRLLNPPSVRSMSSTVRSVRGDRDPDTPEGADSGLKRRARKGPRSPPQ